MNDQKNMILAIALSALVLIGWQFFIGMPQMEKQKQETQLRQQQTQAPPAATPGTAAAPQTPPAGTGQSTGPQAPGSIGAPLSGQQMTREAALATSPRVAIQTPSVTGSVSLKGGRIDDLSFVRFRETVDPKSPAIVLLEPSLAPNPFYAEFGWVAGSGTTVKLPGADTLWRQDGSGILSPGKPLTLAYDNGEGLEFRRTIAVDDKYLFTISDQVANKSSAPVSLFPFALISRHNTPHTLGYYILHEGLIGVLDDKLQEITYSDIEKQKLISFKISHGWLGITDKYWAATLLPDPKANVQARFSFDNAGARKAYQTDYLLEQQTVAPGATATAQTMLFAGAKEVAAIDGYEKLLGLDRFDRLIDWGWFYFITKPLFWLIDWLFKWLGNFGLAILAVTVIIKAAFFPLANKSYASMAKMKTVQPEMVQIRERYADDKVKQQQALMELYKKEKINPLAGCLPILVQIPVFFALYKVLFVTIEMRQAPFYGWIKDLAAPDPTNVFNLFGLIAYDPTQLPVFGHFLWLGVWPLIMGVTMWVQMKLNPAPPDPTQAMIFAYMPIIFTFMLASFPAGLVIYWAWNNTLSVAQQSIIMKKNGAKIELFDNIKATFGLNKKDSPSS